MGRDVVARTPDEVVVAVVPLQAALHACWGGGSSSSDYGNFHERAQVPKKSYF